MKPIPKDGNDVVETALIWLRYHSAISNHHDSCSKLHQVCDEIMTTLGKEILPPDEFDKPDPYIPEFDRDLIKSITSTTYHGRMIIGEMAKRYLPLDEYLELEKVLN